MRYKKLNSLNILYIVSAILSSIVGLFILTYIVPSASFLPLIIVFFPALIIILLVIGVPSFFLLKKCFKRNIHLLIYSSVMIVFIIFYIFIVSYQIGPVEDDSFLNWMCKLKPAHEIKVSKTAYPCEHGKYNVTSPLLEKWKNFHGCNNLTKRYDSQGYVKGIEICKEKNPFQM